MANHFVILCPLFALMAHAIATPLAVASNDLESLERVLETLDIRASFRLSRLARRVSSCSTGANYAASFASP